MKIRYKDLSWLIGQDVTVFDGLDLSEFPDRAVVVDEYPKHLMLELHYTHSVWGMPYHRTLNKRINKASMFCGDVLIRCNGILLTGDEVNDQPDPRLLKEAKT